MYLYIGSRQLQEISINLLKLPHTVRSDSSAKALAYKCKYLTKHTGPILNLFTSQVVGGLLLH